MKHCPICDSETWDYDVIDGLFTYCGPCYVLINKQFKQDTTHANRRAKWFYAMAKVINQRQNQFDGQLYKPFNPSPKD